MRSTFAGQEISAGYCGPATQNCELGRRRAGSINSRSTVDAVRSEIAEVEFLLGFLLEIQVRIDGAIQRPCPLGHPSPLELIERRSAREGEVDVEPWDQFGRQIFKVAPPQLRQRDWRVDVVEGRHAARRLGDPPTQRHSLRHIRADDHDIGVRDESRLRRFDLVEVPMENRFAVRRSRQVTIRRVPGDVALEEQDFVSPRRECLHERSERRGVPVPPARRDRQSEDHDLQRFDGLRQVISVTGGHRSVSEALTELPSPKVLVST